MRYRKMIAILCAGLMLLACAGCSYSGRAADPYDNIPESSGGKDVVKGKAADHVFSLNSNSKYSFNPIVATNHANQLICDLVYENMVEVDNDFNVIYNVIVSGSCDETATTWTFKMDLENPHYFHDGTKVTAYDLRYSLEYAINADRFKGRFASFQGASHDNDTGTLYVTLGVGDTQFIKLLNIPIIQQGTFGHDRPGGSGPYKYNEDYTKLEAFTGYNGYESLPMDEIEIKEYSDMEGTIIAYEDSLIDVVVNDPTSYTNLGYASTNEIHNFPTTNLHFVAFNEDSIMGKYTAFRYAASYAFDRSYLEELLNTNAVGTPVPMYPTCADYPAELAKSMAYNLDTAAIVLDNAGIIDYDNDGWREYMNGSAQDFEVVFIVCSDSSAKAGIANKFAEDMGSLGVKVNVKELDWETYVKALEEGELTDKNDKKSSYDMYYCEVKLRSNFDLTELLQVRDKDNESYNLNFTKSKDANYLNLINQYLAAPDELRASRYKDLCSYINSNSLFITIGFEKQQIISHRGVIKGINPNAGNPLFGIEDWIVDLS